MIFADSTTGGYLAGNIVAGGIAVVCLLLIATGIYMMRTNDSMYVHENGFWIVVPSVLVLILTVVAWFWSTWPFAYEYHHWIDKKVTVDTAPSSRFLTDSDGNINQKFVIESSGSYYGINDTRAALIKQGDTVNLRCKKAYDYGVPRSSHGWDCKWNGNTP